jgi:hypothetical protein
MQRFTDKAYLQFTDLERLGSRLAARSDYASAASVLAVADEIAPPDAEAVRILLFDALLAEGRFGEAQERAAHWIGVWRKPHLAAQFILAFARRGLETQALALLRQSERLLPQLAIMVVDTLKEAGNLKFVQRIIEAWAKRVAAGDPNVVRQYVAAVLATGDATGLFRTLRMLLQHDSAADASVMLAEAIGRSLGLAALAPFLDRLSFETLAKRPIFAAELFIFEGNPLLAHRLLETVDLDRLTPDDRTKWFGLVRTSMTDSGAFLLLSGRWRQRRLLPAFAELAELVGRPQLHDSVWREINRSTDSVPQNASHIFHSCVFFVDF